MNKKVLLVVLGTIFLIALAPEAHAAGSGGSLPYEGWLTSLVNSFKGPVAYAASMIGIIISGATLIFGGEINGFAKTMLFIVLVLSLLVGASAILADMTGTSGAEVVQTATYVKAYLA